MLNLKWRQCTISLCEGEGAQKVWSFFAKPCNINVSHSRNWEGMVNIWWQRASLSSQVGWIKGLIPIMISWELGKARCAVRMEGIKFKSEHVIREVKVGLRNISTNMKRFRHMGGNDKVILDSLNCLILPIVKKKPLLILWRKPVRGRLKLNVDGGCCGNPRAAGGGGILWDSNGDVVVGFSHYYGQATNNIAECKAVLDGLRLCKQLRLRDVLIESDSLVIINWLE